MAMWNALIRTHHITSRKKVAKLKQAASAQAVFVLLRSGGSPGIMYVEGSKDGVEDWVGDVQVGTLRKAKDLCFRNACRQILANGSTEIEI